MSEEAMQFWQRAENALNAARRNIEVDLSTVGNRAYYTEESQEAIRKAERILEAVRSACPQLD